jgi:transposase
LLAAGESQAEVARQVGVSRQTVVRWDRARQEGGTEALRRAAHFGRPERLSAAQRDELVRLLKQGALAAGFPTELWTLPRIAQLIEAKFAVPLVPSSVWWCCFQLVSTPTALGCSEPHFAARSAVPGL